MKRLVALATAVALSSGVSLTHAAPPFTEETVQLSGQLGYGVYMGDGDLNPYGVGLGARGGYTLRPGIYLGGLFDFFFGETDDAGALGFTGEASANAWLLQGEVGYDIGVSRGVVIRPKIGLGMTQITTEGCFSAPIIGEECTDDTDGEFAFAIGAEAPIDLGGFFVSPEMRFNIVDDASGFIMAVGAGAAF